MCTRGVCVCVCMCVWPHVFWQGTKKVLVPHWNQEPRTKIAQKVLGESWFLVLGSSEVLVPS